MLYCLIFESRTVFHVFLVLFDLWVKTSFPVSTIWSLNQRQPVGVCWWHLIRQIRFVWFSTSLKYSFKMRAPAVKYYNLFCVHLMHMYLTSRFQFLFHVYICVVLLNRKKHLMHIAKLHEATGFQFLSFIMLCIVRKLKKLEYLPWAMSGKKTSWLHKFSTIKQNEYLSGFFILRGNLVTVSGPKL